MTPIFHTDHLYKIDSLQMKFGQISTYKVSISYKAKFVKNVEKVHFFRFSMGLIYRLNDYVRP